MPLVSPTSEAQFEPSNPLSPVGATSEATIEPPNANAQPLDSATSETQIEPPNPLPIVGPTREATIEPPVSPTRETHMLELAHFQVIGAALFAIGIYGVLARRSAVLILMSIELMLNAVNINLIGFAAFGDFTQDQRALGQVLIIFVITIAAAELALAIAIILRLYRNRSSVNIDQINLMKW